MPLSIIDVNMNLLVLVILQTFMYKIFTNQGEIMSENNLLSNQS